MSSPEKMWTARPIIELVTAGAVVDARCHVRRLARRRAGAHVVRKQEGREGRAVLRKPDEGEA